MKKRVVVGIFTLSLFLTGGCPNVIPTSTTPLTTVAWTANPSSDNVQGYKVYVGTASGTYSTVKDVGVTTNYSLSNLGVVQGATYYVTVSAYNSSGEGVKAKEIAFKCC